jgi:hypothetical protein
MAENNNENNKYILYCTFYDLAEFRKSILLLQREGIEFQIVNKSNPMNYRVPSSTYIEIELFIKTYCFYKADKILKTFHE